MKKSIKYNGEVIEYSISRSGRRTVGISIKSGEEVHVSAPYRVSDTYLQDIVRKKAEWILKKLRVLKDANAGRKYFTGEAVTILGEEYRIDLQKVHGLSGIHIFGSGNIVTISVPQNVNTNEHTESIKEALEKWLKELACKIVTERMRIFSAVMKVAPNKVFFKSQKTIWGSCTKDNNININWRIIMAPLDIIDYLVVHELAHIRHKNHSKVFWDAVGTVLWDHTKRRKWLKDNGHKLHL